MRERTRTKLKIISSLAMSLLSLFSLVALTIAWFAQNETTNADGMNVMINADNRIYGYDFYNIDADANGFTFVKTPAADAKLGIYSMMGEKFQLLVKIYVSSDLDTITLRASTSTDYFLGDGNHDLLAATAADQNVPMTGTTADGAEYTNVMTSVVRIAAITSGVTENGNNCEIAALPADETFGRFIDTAADPATINNFNAKSVANAETITLPAETVTYGDKTAKVFFVIIDYDRLLLSTIFSKNLANEILQNADVKIPFKCDFVLSLTQYTTV